MSKTLRAMLTTVLIAIGAVAIASPDIVQAGVGASAVPSFPTTITVGDTGVTASIVLTNQNTVDADGDHLRENTVCNEGDAFPCPAGGEGITLVPSCGVVAAPTACAPAGADPDVFAIDAVAVGSAAGGSECGGMTFSVALTDPVLGKYQFTPTTGNVTLSVRDAFCRIDFTYDVLKVPSIDQDAGGAADIQTAQVVANTQIVEVGSPNRSVPGSGSGTSVRTVARAQPTITTQASPATTIGSELTDVATLAGVVSPVAGATVAFTLYGPDDADCVGAPAFVSTVAYPVGGGAVTSEPFDANGVGLYRWVASYSGDANNAPVAGACNDADEDTAVGRAQPTIVTTASPSVQLGGGPVTDSAVVSGRIEPLDGATIDFHLYGPADPDCSGTPVHSSLGVPYPVAGGPVSSSAYTPTVAGSYRWVASYSGDANNEPAVGACGAPDENVDVERAGTTIATVASDDVEIGGALSDSATVSGRVDPQQATVDFRLYGPDDAACSGAPLFESLGVAYPVAGGAVVSGEYTPVAPGEYRWVASYSGDTNNAPPPGPAAMSPRPAS